MTDFEQTPPPCSKDAEEAVLGSNIVAKDSYDRVRGLLEPKHFFFERNKVMFAVIAELYDEGSSTDAVTVAQRLKDKGQLAAVGGSPYIGYLLFSVPYVENIEQYANIVRELARVRDVMALSQRYAAEARVHGADSVQPWIEQYESELTIIVSGVSKTSLLFAHPIAVEAFHALRAAADGTGALGEEPTGYREIDKFIGGLHNGDFYILAGRPGMGKTSLAMQIARAVAAERRRPVPKDAGVERAGEKPESQDDDDWMPGDAVAFFTLEMPTDQIGLRLAAITSGVDTHRLRRGNMNPKEWVDLEQSVRHLSKIPIWLDGSAAVSVSQIRSRSRQLQAAVQSGRAEVKAGRLGLVVIDYLQLIEATHLPGRTRESEVAAISRGLKAMAKDLNIPVLALSQLSRKVEERGKDKRPELSDLRESGALEQDTDCVMFVYRPGYYEPKNEELKGIAEIIIAKNRHGPTGSGKLYFDGKTTKFTDRADEYDEFGDFAEG